MLSPPPGCQIGCERTFTDFKCLTWHLARPVEPCTQELHSLCGAVLFQCMEAAGDRGASWLRLGFGKDILHAITSLPTHHGEMRVREWRTSQVSG